MKYPFQQLSDTNAPLSEALKEAAARVIDSGYYLLGPETKRFEEALAHRTGTAHAVATGNGLDAIRLILRALLESGRLHKGDSILVAANTYIASILPMTEMGLRPQLVDADPVTMNMDLHKALEAIGPDTKGAMLVHLYGTPCYDAAAIAEFRQRGLVIVEDNAQAIGAAVLRGNTADLSTGAIGDAAAFSFYPSKNIGALGDAGAVTTDDPTLAAAVRALANYGSDRRYHNIYCGYNSRMDELQAAFLHEKLKHLDAETAARTATAYAYDAEICNPLLKKPAIIAGFRQVWHQYVVCVNDRDDFMRYLNDNGVGSAVHYAVPPHRQPCYDGVLTGDFPVTEKLADSVVSLPIANITPEQAREIAGIINDYRK